MVLDILGECSHQNARLPVTVNQTPPMPMPEACSEPIVGKESEMISARQVGLNAKSKAKASKPSS